MTVVAGHLTLEDVDAGYRGDLVLRGVSLELQRGEVVGLVSIDSWGGKSTLLRVAAGLLPPRRGRVLFQGDDVYAMGFAADQRFRARVAWVPEGGALLVNQSVWENVALPLRYHLGLRGRELEVKVTQLLEQVGFTEDPRQFPWQVSGRGRKLAAFARALSRGPSLVLVDRFFEGLEMPEWKRLFELVLELNHTEGTTWLLASEVDPAIFQVAERVAVLERGAVLACGARRQLYREERIRAAFEAAKDQAELAARRTGRVDPAALRAELAQGADDGAAGVEAAAGRAVEAVADAGLSSTIVVDGRLAGLRPSSGRARAPDLGDPERTAVLDAPTPAPDVDATLTLDAGAVRAARAALRAEAAAPAADPEQTLTIDGVVGAAVRRAIAAERAPTATPPAPGDPKESQA